MLNTALLTFMQLQSTALSPSYLNEWRKKTEIPFS